MSDLSVGCWWLIGKKRSFSVRLAKTVYTTFADVVVLRGKFFFFRPLGVFAAFSCLY